MLEDRSKVIKSRGTGYSSSKDDVARLAPPRKKGDIAIEFLQDLHGKDGPWILTAIIPDGPTCTRTFTAADLKAMRRFIVDRNARGENIYYTLNHLAGPTSRKPKKADIAEVGHLHVDADPEAGESPEAFKARIRPVIDDYQHRPSFEIDSGNGIQLLFALKRRIAVTDQHVIADIEARNYALAQAFKADASTRNIDRILRLRGTTNHPNAKKLKDGRVPCRAKLLKSRERSYELLAFPKGSPPSEPARTETKLGEGAVLPPNVGHYLHLKDDGGFDTRSGLFWAFLQAALRNGIDERIVIQACLDQAYKGCAIYEHCAAQKTPGYLQRQIDKARAQVAKGEADDTYSWDDPDVSLLEDRRGELPEFPLDVLEPEELRDWVQRAARGTGTSAGHVAVPFLAVAGSLIGTSYRIRASTSWSEPLTIWGIVVGHSGTGKTPALNVSKAALERVEQARQPNIEAQQRKYEERAALQAATHKKWTDEVKDAVKKGKKPPPKPMTADDPGEFVAPRISVTDITIEKVTALLQARPQGMLLIDDELAGWFHNMSRYSGGGGQDNQFWLKCWDGKSHKVERVKNRVPIVIPHLLVGVTGGLQPDKLAEVFAGAADGMYARPLFAWPETPPYEKLSNDVAETDPKIVALFGRLSAFTLKADAAVWLSPDALKLFEAFRQERHELAQLLDGRELDWWAKAPAQVLRLAGILAFVKASMGDEERRMRPKKIAGRYMARAIELVRDYFWPHARACLRQIGLTEKRADARRVLKWIKMKALTEVSREIVRRETLAQRLDADDTDLVLKELERTGWLRRMSTQPSTKGGRPPIRLEVNPKLAEVLMHDA